MVNRTLSSRKVLLGSERQGAQSIGIYVLHLSEQVWGYRFSWPTSVKDSRNICNTGLEQIRLKMNALPLWLFKLKSLEFLSKAFFQIRYECAHSC